MDKVKRIKELVNYLNEQRAEYYNENSSKISDAKYDKLYSELETLEKETSLVLSNSPTVEVGADVSSSKLEKENHVRKMLSLDKTKSVDDLESFLSEKEGVLSLKLDGLTVVLTYEDGVLTKALTRGDGITGEIVTKNAKQFTNLPLQIAHKEKLIIRGEAIIKYSDFNILKEEEANEDFKNPRNLASGSVRLIDNEENKKKGINTKNRRVSFYAFTIAHESKTTDTSNVKNEKNIVGKTITEDYKFLEDLGFMISPYRPVTKKTIRSTVLNFKEELESNDLPADGLVLTYDDIVYGESLGETAKFPRNAVAFKWEDETKETVLTDIKWQTSRTGLINPIAVFNAVEIEGSTISRASLHNLSIIKDLHLHIGDKISVYKANMIIPQILENLSGKEYEEKARTRDGEEIPFEFDETFIPKICPVCESETKIINLNGTLELICTNKDCPARNLKKFEHFVSKKCFNIEGLSTATLKDFIDADYLNSFVDIFRLEKNFGKEIERKIEYKKNLTSFISKYSGWINDNSDKESNEERTLFSINTDSSEKKSSKNKTEDKKNSERQITSIISIEGNKNINLFDVLKKNNSQITKIIEEKFDAFKNEYKTTTKNLKEARLPLINFFKKTLEEERKNTLEGFDTLSTKNLYTEIDNSRKIKLSKFINSLGIRGVGESVAELISSFYDNSPKKLLLAKEEDLIDIDGIGEIIAKDFVTFINEAKNKQIINELLDEVDIIKEEPKSKKLDGLTFVITGSLNSYKDRTELSNILKNKGAKVSSSVTKNTSYLINNDITSQSSKNKTAKELGIKIITEDEVRKIIEE